MARALHYRASSRVKLALPPEMHSYVPAAPGKIDVLAPLELALRDSSNFSSLSQALANSEEAATISKPISSCLEISIY